MSQRATLFGVIAAQRRFVYLVVALLSVAGIWAATQLPSAIYPELQFPRVTVLAGGSSLSAQQQVYSVTRPLEEELGTVLFVRRVDSRSIRGQSEIQMLFAPGTDMIYALQLVRAAIATVQPDLPVGVTVTAERITPSVYPILSYNVEGGDPATLYDIARYQLRPVISRVPAVGAVEVMGSDVREVEVVANPARLAQHGMSYGDFAGAISRAIAVSAIGRVNQDYQQLLVITDNAAHTVDDVANVVVAPGVRVRDLASVTLGTEDHTQVIAGDGRPAALINITRQIGGNTLAIADSVAAVMHTLASALPPGVHVKPVYDQAELVRDAVKAVRDAIVIGAILAIVILLLFLRHVRITAISAASIPLTLMITLFVMRLLGQTLNLMTLGAMAIAIGLVIDDAVVVTENIVRHLHLTRDRGAAVAEAVRELAWPVTTSTLTTVVVFLPLGLLEGVVGQFFKALSLTLTIAVLISLVLAFTVIPLLSAQFVTARDADADEGLAGAGAGHGGMLARLGRRVDALSAWYERVLGVVLLHTRWVVGAGLVLVAAGYLAYRTVPTGFLPEMDEGAFILDYWLPPGTSLQESDRQLREVEHLVASVPEVTGTSRRLGAELGLFATQQNRGDITVRLAPPGQRHRSIFQVIAELRDTLAVTVPQVHVEFVQILSDALNDMAGVASPVEVKVFGPNLDTLEAYAGRLGTGFSAIPGVEDPFDGVVDPSPELAVRVDQPQAARVGLAPDAVASQVSGALLGVPAGQLLLDDRAIGVRVRAPDSLRYDPAALGVLPLVTPGSRTPVPLASVASVRRIEARSELTRENQQQLITMTADLGDQPLGSVMHGVQAMLQAHPAPVGVRVELGGQYASQRDAFRQMLLVLALAAASVVAVMLIQFRSFVEPLVILVAAPLSFVGAMAALLATGTALNVSSLMGLILLIGLIVKNGIILLDFTHWRMQHNAMPLEAAIRDAARVRLRPILMTTLCTLFGLLPLALGIGAGSELQKPLALAVIGGLALSTPITLFVVPTLVVAVRGRGFRLRQDAP